MSAFALREALDANDRERRRLTLLVNDLDDRVLGETVHGRWTVAATLAHLAYWDRFALGLLERWAAGQPYETDGLPPWHDHAVNDALLDAALVLPAAAAVRLATEAAGAIDARLSDLGEAAGHLLTDRDAEWLLRRHRHRAEHLDEIEVALGLRGC
ncbi:MAG: DinB family protein [Chloroflexota bacterium]